MFYLMQTITLDTFGSMYMTYKNCVLLFPTILVLRNSRIHVCSSDHHNVAFYVKTSVSKVFNLSVTLKVPYVNLDNYHIRFWISFENVGCLKNPFNNV